MATFTFSNATVRIEAYNNYFFVRNYSKPQNAPMDAMIRNDKKFEKFVALLENANFSEETTYSQIADLVIGSGLVKGISYRID